jgi:DNA polymerase-2
MNQLSIQCFLLNYTSHDFKGRFEITLHAVASDCKPVKVTIDTFRPLFFVPRSTPAQKTSQAAERKSLKLKGMDGTDVDCLYFNTYTSYLDCSRRLRLDGIPIYESDVAPVERYLMERFICGGFDATGSVQTFNNRYELRNPLLHGIDHTPQLKVLSLDIETNATTDQIYCIASYSGEEQVFIIGQGTDVKPVTYCTNEKDLLCRFFKYLSDCDPDIIIGWSIVDFDLRVIQNRCNIHSVPFTLGREVGARIVPSRNNNNMVARIPGRVIMDVPLMLRSYYHTFEEYSLNFVASEMLGKSKTIELTDQDKIDEINRLFIEDKQNLAIYNLQDTILTWEIFKKAGILPNAIERTKRSGHLLDRTGGSIAAFDYLYLPRLHREGFVAKDCADVLPPTELLPGGFVLEPIPGLYENVLVLDFRSLYPSIIQTFKIDPLGLIALSEERIKGPAGPSFAKSPSILPEIISQLMEARSAAKKDNNPYLSQAIKILMNSFYGVMGATNCRFFSSILATAITRTGQYILKQMIEYISISTPFKVIYGDTDSLFVHLGKGKEEEADSFGADLALNATAWLTDLVKDKFKSESVLKLEYQNTFRHFFIPSVRGATHGSKKHYCGSTVDQTGMHLLFKGMESARSDWTDLAKDFQYELYMSLFTGKPVEDFILETVRKVRHGELNDKLIYKKRLRKDIDDYTVNVPPHAQAAKLLDSQKHIVRYYITVNGPQPLEKLSAPIDYNHYIECQLRPIADSILAQSGDSFDRIVSGQQDLFG